MKLRALLLSFAALSAAGVFVATPAIASTVVYNQPYTTDNSYTSDLTPQAAADNFTLPTTAQANGVTWDGTYFSSQPGGFYISFYTDNSGAPGTLLATDFINNASISATPDTVFGYQIYSYSANIPTLTFTGGTEYWISITGNTNNNWMWSTGSGGDNTFYSAMGGSPTTGSDLAFGLIKTTPEPSTLALAATGMICMFFFMRRRTAAAQL